jgi:hypothetical protein
MYMDEKTWTVKNAKRRLQKQILIKELPTIALLARAKYLVLLEVLVLQLGERISKYRLLNLKFL